MVTAKTDLAAILCSKLCHDLVSPVGALANGVELLADEDDEEMRREALKLLEMSAAQASRRLSFYRLAFGASGGAARPITLDEAHAVVADYFADGKIELDWRVSRIELDKKAVKLLLNLILLAQEALIRGGRLEVDLAPRGAGLRLEVRARGAGAMVHDDVARILDDRAETLELAPRHGPAILAAGLAEDLGGTLGISQTADDQVAIVAELAV